MSLADEVIKLRLGTPEFNALRKAATEGKADALKKYVYWCAWRGIRADVFIPPQKKAAVFRALVQADKFEVILG